MKVLKKLSIIMLAVVIVAISLFFLSSKDIYLIFTSDVHSFTEETNNYSSIKQIKKNYQKEGYAVLIDGGDFAQGNEPGNSSKGLDIIDLMNYAGYDYATIGNHDFDFGLDSVAKMVEDADFSFIVSNLEYEGKETNKLKGTVPYVIKRYGLKKVAYIGILQPDIIKEGTLSKEALGNDFDDYNIFCDINDINEEGVALINRIQEVVNQVKSKADYVVVISHLGIGTDNILTSDELPKFVSGIDIILNGHSHNPLNTVITDKDGNDVVVISVNKAFIDYGVIKINKNDEIEAELVN